MADPQDPEAIELVNTTSDGNEFAEGYEPRRLLVSLDDLPQPHADVPIRHVRAEGTSDTPAEPPNTFED